MRPTARQLIESVDWALQHKVLPTVEDKWAASAMRSAHCLLQHLAVRVEAEGELLHEDNRDLRTVLAGVQAGLATATDAAERGLADQLADVLQRSWRAPDAYPTVASLSEENIALRELLDLLLEELDASAGGVRAELEAYVRRRLQRDQPLFIPAFLSSTF